MMSSNETGKAGQFLTFTLDNDNFALEIDQVREVLDYAPITKVPRMPDFLRGVINLRGNVVPVIDLRLKLEMGAVEETVDTCIIIAEIMIDDELTQVGALADSVREVISLYPDQISPPPRLGTRLRSEFIKGMGRQDEKFLIVLDIDRIFSEEELAIVRETVDIDGQQTEIDSAAEDIQTNEFPPVLDINSRDEDESEI